MNESDAKGVLGTILEAVGRCVAVLDRNGDVMWSNRHHDTISDEVWTKISAWCREMFEAYAAGDADRHARQFLVSTRSQSFFEVIAAPIGENDEQPDQLAVLITDATHTRRMQRKIDAIDSAGRVLVRLDAQELARMDVTERLALLEDRIVESFRELMHFSNFAIWILDRKTRKLELLVNYELPSEAVEVDLHASTEGNGIVGYVADTGRSYICPDVQNDPRYLPGLQRAASSLTVPMTIDNEVIGVLDVESVEYDTFSEDDRQFAEIFGRYVAIALNTFDLLVTEQVTTTGKLANNVQCEIGAPLNDIITDATTLMEDYIGHDDLRHRLQAICDNVMSVKRSVQEVAEPRTGMLGRSTKQTDPILKGRRVLVADDEPAILETISEVLANSGCEVETAHDGAEAVSMIAKRDYDVVLSDIKMPQRNGYEVFAAAKDRRPDCAVILMTGFGYDPNHSIIRARREGLSAVMFKPFKVDQLLNELRNAVQSQVARTVLRP